MTAPRDDKVVPANGKGRSKAKPSLMLLDGSAATDPLDDINRGLFPRDLWRASHGRQGGL